MTAMRDAVADLAPMMQGTVPYDAVQVSEGASVIASHAGDRMLSLFPENSLEGKTYARPEIWSDWQSFAALAAELQTVANALVLAAPNGLEPAAPGSEEMAAIVDPGMTPAAEPEAERAFTVAELMGYGEAAREADVSRGTDDPAAVAPDLTTLAADDLFTLISTTCSACHSQFRAGRN